MKHFEPWVLRQNIKRHRILLAPGTADSKPRHSGSAGSCARQKLNHLPGLHVNEVELCHQLLDKPWCLFSEQSKKDVKIIHPHMLGLKIVCTVDMVLRNVQAVFLACLGESSNGQNPFT